MQNSAQSLVYVQRDNTTTNIYTVNTDGTLADTGDTTSRPKIASGGQTIAMRGDEAFAYIIPTTAQQVLVVDTTSAPSVVQTASFGSTTPVAIVVSADGSRVYGSDASSQLKVFSANALTGKLDDSSPTVISTGCSLTALAVAPDGSRVYGVCNSGNSVKVIDTASNTVTATVTVGSSPLQAAVSPDGTRVYVTNSGSNTVSVIDTSTNTVVNSPATGSSPYGVVMTPDGAHYYVANNGAGTISQFNSSDNSSIAPAVSVGGTPQRLVITPDGKFLYSTDTTRATAVAGFSIDATTGALTSIGAVTSDTRQGTGISLGTNGNALLASGKTFVARRAAALGTTGSGGASFTGGTLRISGTGETISTPMTLGSGGGTIDTNGNDSTVSSNITGSGGLTKAGTGYLALSGTNSYSGATTINGGDMWLTGSTAAASAVTAANGTRLIGDGAANGPVTIQSGANLAPGSGGPGQFATGSLALNTGSTLSVELNGATVGTGYDRVNVTGTVTLGGTLDATLGYTPAAGQTFTIINNDGSDAVAGTFAGLAEGSTFTLGGYTLKISYAGGDGNDVVLAVMAFPTLSTLASSGVVFGGSVSDAATIGSGVSPTGTITFRLYGPNDATCTGTPAFTDTKTVTANGTYVSTSFTPASAGTYRWIASYSGDFTNTAKSGACNDTNESVVVSKADQTITFGSLSGKSFGDAPFTVSATAGSGLAVTFTSQTTSVCTVSGNTVTIAAAGTCTIAADQAGNGNYNAAPQVTQSFAVAKATQTIAFGTLQNEIVTSAPFTVSATSSSGLAVTFSSQTSSVCTVSGSAVTLIAVGTCTIAANQAGNSNYGAATQVTQSFTVLPNCSAVTIAQTSLPTGVQGLAYSQALTVTNGASPITWGITGALPSGISFTNGTFSGTPTVSGAFPVTVTATDANACQTTASLALPVAGQHRVVVGAGAGGAPTVRAFDLTGTIRADFNAYSTAFAGGVSVAQGDTNGDGVPDIITGAGPGGGPHVQVFDGATNTPRLSFFAFAPGFRGGVEVAAGDVNGDGYADVIAVGGCDAAPVARAFDGRTGALLKEYAIATPTWSCGFHVAAGDVNGDGYADIIVGAGDGASFVQVIDGATGSAIRTLAPYGAFAGGAYVAAGDVNGDGYADIVTGAGPGGGPHVQVFDGRTGSPISGPLAGFMAYDVGFRGGVRVAAGDLNGDGRAEVITAAGPGGGPHVRVFDGATGNELVGLFALDPSFSGGVYVGGAATLGRMSIDVAAQTTGSQVVVAGWALREGSGSVGTDAIHVWAFPVAGGAPVFVGAASSRVARGDVASAFGGEFYMSGFEVTGPLAPGTYDLIVFARNSVTGVFDQARVVRITVN